MRVGGRWSRNRYQMQRCFCCPSMTASVYVAVFATLSVTCSALISAEETESFPLCPAGSYLSQSSPEKCLACKASATYMDRPNREHACNPCTKCDSMMIQVTPCSVTADALCECHEGYFKNIEGRCSPKVISPVANAVRSHADGKPDVSSTSSKDETEYQLDVVIGLVIAVVLLIAVKIVLDTVWRCHRRKKTRACAMGCSLKPLRDDETGTFRSKRYYDRPGQVADEQDKLIDSTLNPSTDSHHLTTIASAQGAFGLDVTGVNDRCSSAKTMQAGGEQCVQNHKAEKSRYFVAIKKEADDNCESSESHGDPSRVLHTSTVGCTSTQV